MMLSNNHTLESVNSEVLKFIRLFQSNPFRYLYESDIQGELFSRLREAIPGTLTIAGEGRPHHEYVVSVVNTEYLSRIDIACLDIEKAAHHKPRNHKGFDMHLYDIPVYTGIEIKYRKLGDRFGLDSCLSDLKKLQDLNIPHPVVLGFIQSESDVEAFFSNLPESIECAKTSLDAPITTINIVSPKCRWDVIVKP